MRLEQIALDRTLYRPGQTLCYKVLLGREGEVLANRPVCVKLVDCRYEMLDSALATTNAFGSVAGNFQLPNNVGQYKIEVSYWNGKRNKEIKDVKNGRATKHVRSFNAAFQVEEYRLPTFKVEAVRDTNEYALGDTIAVAGYALSLTDVPLSGALVQLHCSMSEMTGVRFVDTTVFCDAEGRFVWRWATPSESSAKDFLMATVEMTVTDVQGESHSTSVEYTLSRKSLFVELNIPEEADRQREDTLQWRIYAENADLVDVSVPLSLWVERLTTPPYYKGQVFPRGGRPTVWLHSEADYAAQFPSQTLDENFDVVKNWPVQDTILKLQQVFHARQPLSISVKDWPLGMYRVTAEGMDRRGEKIRKVRYMQLYDSKAMTATLSQPVYVRMPSQGCLGDTLPVLVGTSLKNARVFCVVYQGEKVIYSNMLPLSAEQQMLLVPTNKKQPVQVRVVAYAVQHGVSYHDVAYQELTMPEWKMPSNKLTLKLVHWNRSVETGQRQEWELEVQKADSTRAEAEVLVSMVDDAIVQLQGAPKRAFVSDTKRAVKIPKQMLPTGFFGDVHSYSNHVFSSSLFEPLPVYNGLPFPDAHFAIPFKHLRENFVGRTTPGRSVAMMLYEPPVWAGSGSEEKIPRVASFAQQNVEAASIRMDDEDDNPHPMVLHEVEVAPDAQNVLQNTNVRVRNRFEETAFFYPQLRTDARGGLKFAFTLPDQFTQWYFYADAHTQDLMFGGMYEKVLCRRSLMVQSHCPRFLREGDTLAFAVKLTNLCDTAMTGTMEIAFFDPQTNQPLPLLVNAADSVTRFRCDAQGVDVFRWNVAVPEGLQTVAYRVLAQSGNYGDGEEKVVPVLSSRQVVTESKSFFVPADTVQDVVLENLARKSATLQSLSYSFEVITNPVWLAITALPYMAYERGNGNNSIASALYANAIARRVIEKFPEIETAYAQWLDDTVNQSMTSPLLRDENFKTLQLAETPWMRYALSENQQRLDMAKLFNRHRLNNERERLLNRLRMNQMPDGGWDWYGRAESSEDITADIVANYQKLLQMQVDVPEVKQMIRRALSYLDSCASRKYQQYLKLKEKNAKYSYCLYPDDIHYLYARSFNTSDTTWLQQPHSQMIWRHLLDYRERFSYAEQAEIAIILNRLGQQQVARKMVEGLRQQAIVSDLQGMYWPSVNQRVTENIHQQVMMMEAFRNISPNQHDMERMRQWLITQKKGLQWPSDAATAEVVFALLQDENQVLLDPARTQMVVGGRRFSTASDALTEVGTGRMMKTWLLDEVTPALASVTVQTDARHSAMGNLFWQYAERQSSVEDFGNGIFLQRELCHQRVVDGSVRLEPVTRDDPAMVGEKLTVRIVLRSTRELDFVQINDQRSAAVESLASQEQFRMIGNVSYFEVPHDASTRFFIRHLPIGTYVFEYEVVASQCGIFSGGLATVESVYAPEYRSCGSSPKLVVKTR